MRRRFLSSGFFFFLILQLWGQSFSLVTWNIQNLGRSKSDQEIHQMAQLLRHHDLIAIQEVVAIDPAGARAVAKIVDELNRMGAKWDYRVSNPTQSPSSYKSERYAFIWKTSKLRLKGNPVLDLELVQVCWREPYVATFILKGSERPFYLINVHSRTYNENPQEEIAHIVQYPARFKSNHVLIAGDFNTSEKDPIWSPLYNQGFDSVVSDCQTTLKKGCKGNDYLNHPIDNIFFHPVAFQLQKSGSIDHVKECEHLDAARALSDHLPVFVELTIQ